MPTPTDLVTDLPADFEVFGQAVDTQMKTNADAATQKATLTTKGDIYAASGTSTPARVAVGTNGQVLTADSTAATGVKWATSAGASETTFTLLNAGGTALTGAQTITVSSISGYDAYFVLVVDASSASSNSTFGIRPNNNSTSSNYLYGFNRTLAPATYSIDITAGNAVTTASSIPIGQMANTAGAAGGGSVILWGGKETGLKSFFAAGGGDNYGGATNQVAYTVNGLFNSTSVISSMSVFSSVGNFDAGTIYVYGGTI
jgi:hypothetical protein